MYRVRYRNYRLSALQLPSQTRIKDNFQYRRYSQFTHRICEYFHQWFKCLSDSISAILKVPDGTFSWKWVKSLAQRSDLNLIGSTWSPTVCCRLAK